MPTDAFEMAIVHRVFRNELRNAPGLIREVEAGDTERSAIVGGHLDFIAAALHHHHAAEDELIWPKLHARAPARAAEITRMEGAHRGIADSVATVQAMLPSWATSADARQAGQLVPAVEKLSALVDEHLADEERNVVPLITEHVTPQAWQEALDRGAAFLSRKNVRLGLVLAGFVLDAASAEEGRRFVAGVPLPQRTLWLLFGKRTFAAYRAKLYGAGGLALT